jgi:hypothetical protein
MKGCRQEQESAMKLQGKRVAVLVEDNYEWRCL